MNGGGIVVGVLGDSTAAGMDNCFYDTYSEGLMRQLKPLFQAANVRTKNCVVVVMVVLVVAVFVILCVLRLFDQ